jgi:hypothetical protein
MEKKKETTLLFGMEQMKIDDLTLLFHSTGYIIQVLYDLVGEDVASSCFVAIFIIY